MKNFFSDYNVQVILEGRSKYESFTHDMDLMISSPTNKVRATITVHSPREAHTAHILFEHNDMPWCAVSHNGIYCESLAEVLTLCAWEKIPPYYIAFDIERAGPTSKYATIAIGISVVRGFKEIDSCTLNGYVEESVVFEDNCWTEFWKSKTEILDALRYTGPESFHERQGTMVAQFQEFRRKWEKIAQEEGAKLLLVTDNPAYDGTFMTLMIERWSSDLGMVYSTGGEYRGMLCTQSLYQGFIWDHFPEYESEWGLEGFVHAHYRVPPKKEITKHMPADDAYEIAFNAEVLRAIMQGKIKRV